MKKSLFLTCVLMITSILYAQHLVEATFLLNRSAAQVQNNLNNWGWNASSMELNDIKIYKITYNTVDVHGNPTIASGALYIPQLDCDTLPLISYQHGTIFDKSEVPSNLYVAGAAFLFSGNGFITTLPDYLGMGVNEGIHPYVHWESEATASVDLMRAAREFLNDSLQMWDNNQLFLTGYSQGGHATMALHKYITVNNLQDEFNVVASAPLSGAYPLFDAQMPGMLDGDSSYYAPQFLPYTLASYQLVYGNIYQDFNEIYDPPYDGYIESWLQAGEDWGELPRNFYDFVQDSVLDNIQNDPNHPINLALRDNDLHNWLPDEPVYMLYCGMDSMVFPQNSIMALDTMLALGATDVQILEIDPDEDHHGCSIPAETYAMELFDSLQAGDCRMVTPVCMRNGAEFSTQAEIDNFRYNYPYCIEIGGDVVISGSDITNIDGLSGLKTISGNLEIHTNKLLEDLSGLDSLESIMGNLKIFVNDVLSDFTGLENLSKIEGHLVIGYNPLLTSLTGLDNIETGSINNLTITYNDNLSYCHIESICEYLVTMTGNVDIHDNAPGCNSQNEVELACPITSIDEPYLSDKLLVYPNPSSTQITIELPGTPQKNAVLTIYNLNSQLVFSGKITSQKTEVDIFGLPKGIYFIKVADERMMTVGKLVKK